ncbi:MAG: TIGR04255 family protein [Candidatus Omnitrophica bacterium]|nr:TIGR04255 family protein [Candidatus Omnitrophota bacterium]
MGKVYKNAPLVEAVFEIRFPAELGIECLRSNFYDGIKEDFPNIFVPNAQFGQALALQPYEFKSADYKKVIRLSINSFSFHTRDYSRGFELFEEECIKYASSFIKYFKISIMNRIGLRYINRIAIMRKNGLIPIGEYLNFGFKLPESISSDPELFHTLLINKVGDGKLRTLIQYQEVPPKDEVVLLDFDYYYEGSIKVVELPKYLAQSHKHIKEDVFKKLISENYMKVLEAS